MKLSKRTSIVDTRGLRYFEEALLLIDMIG